jgi:dimethylargininase
MGPDIGPARLWNTLCVRFTAALARRVGATFADGLTRMPLGSPDLGRASEEHAAYIGALERQGITVAVLPSDDRYPDGPFVEDTAVITERGVILTNPGAPSRVGEVTAIADFLHARFGSVLAIEAPGTVDGGDVCDAGNHVFIGLSSRTNAEGARQLAFALAQLGCTSARVDVNGYESFLHLKSALAALDPETLVVTAELAELNAFARYRRIVVPDDEAYAANCVRVNDVVFVASGFPRTRKLIEAAGWPTEALDMSEFAKMDGGLSCLSLRLP